MRVSLSMWVFGAAVAAGAAGVGLAAAGVASPLRSALVLLFLAVAPTVAIAGLLRTMDVFARVIISCAADIVLLGLVSMVMLAEGVWSPVHGLLVVAAITALCLAAQVPALRRRVSVMGRAVRPRMRAARAETAEPADPRP